MGKIKAVLWDIDGTLLDFGAAQKNAIHSCFEKFGLGVCSEEMLQIYDGINHSYWRRLERGEITKQEVLEGRFYEFFERFGLPTSVVVDFNAEYQVRLGDTVCFYQNALETVKAFKAAGICQLAVTNGTKTAQDRKLKNSGLDNLLDAVFISDVIGVEKPFPGFFEPVFSYLKEKLGEFDKSEILIVGDSLTSDMRGGVNCGIVTCWFKHAGQENTSDLRLDHVIENIGQVRELIGV